MHMTLYTAATKIFDSLILKMSTNILYQSNMLYRPSLLQRDVMAFSVHCTYLHTKGSCAGVVKISS